MFGTDRAAPRSRPVFCASVLDFRRGGVLLAGRTRCRVLILRMGRAHPSSFFVKKIALFKPAFKQDI